MKIKKINKNRVIKYLLIPILIVHTQSYALPEDKSAPLELKAESAQFDQTQGIGRYEGNVVLQQGTLELKADRGLMYLKDGELDKIEAFGNPILIKYLPDANKPWLEGQGKKLIYFPQTGILKISDQVEFIQGSDHFIGDEVEYNTITDQINAKSTSDRPIKFIIQPQKNK